MLQAKKAPQFMRSPRKKTTYAPQFKFERALDSLKSDNVSEVSRRYGLSANLLYLWKDQLLERGAQVFETGPDQAVGELKAKVARLEQMLGKKEVELSLLKNFSDFYSSRSAP